MRYPAAEKLEIIHLVEQPRLPVRRTLDKLGILPASFYRWYDRYQSGGYEALKDRPPRPKQAWNRIPDDVLGPKDLIRHQQQHGLAELFDIKVEQVERFVEKSGALPSLDKRWHRPGRFDGVGTPMGEFDRKTLYAAVRATKPNIVVETGTAAGASSTFVLAALEKNGRGYMHSIDHSDTSENVGILIPEELRSRNKLHSGDSLALLPSLLPEIGPIDFFIHDSHHSYDHMMAEYELALQHLRPGGVIASHDVLYCNAWEHFVRKHRISRVQAVRNFGLCVVDRPIRDR